MLLLIVLLHFPLLTASFLSIAPGSPRGKWADTSLSHDSGKMDVDNDSHSVVHSRKEILRRTPPLLSLLGTEDTWKEWHYSFSRNGLTDFLPQFSDNLDCLMLGTEAEDTMESTTSTSEQGFLPWQQVDSHASSIITNLPLEAYGEGESYSRAELTTNESNLEYKHQVSRLVARTSESITQVGEQRFDCILDGGIMDAVVSSLPSTVTWHSRGGPVALIDLYELMQKANLAIREFGIYVAITEISIPGHAKEYLVAMGEVMGLEWTFDLDGLSNDEYSVSVARKYFTGAVNYDPISGAHDGSGKRFLAP